MTRKEIRKKYNRSKLGVVTNMYHRQKQNSTKRNHLPPTYTKQWLYDHLIDMPLFHKLFDRWVLSDYNKWDKPSVDRIDDNIGYTEYNIQLMTFRDNNKKGGKHIKNGKTRRYGSPTDIKEVAQYSLSGEYVSTYISTHEAMRQTGIPQQNIGKVCLGKRPTAGGYKWEYK